MTETLTRPGTRAERPDLLANRISPREVLAAYEATGYAPTRHSFYRTHRGREMVCALSAVAGERAIREDRPFMPERALSIGEYVEGIVGLEPHYSCGFVYGFDGLGLDFGADEKERTGYRDGARAARFVFGERA